jgi:hypothetical protein
MNKRHLKFAIWAAKATFWLIRAPFVFTYRLYRWIGKLFGGWVLITSHSFLCPGCGEEISLIGRWECGWCSYVFDGFFFSRCKVCGATPPYIQCQACGSGVRNPRLFP